MTDSIESTLQKARELQSAFDVEIAALCERIGYGNVMSSASRLWAKKCDAENMPRSNFTVGPCEALTVKRDHLILDSNGHCDLCCGAGWLTKEVSAIIVGSLDSPK